MAKDVQETKESPLRRWRRIEQLTLEDLSGLTGLSIGMLSLVERGERRLSRRAKVTVAPAAWCPDQEAIQYP